MIDGSLGYICPQSQPDWWTTTLNANAGFVSSIGSNAKQESEDCLFLDVIAPTAGFQENTTIRIEAPPALSPVLIWIHGGNYFMGDKGTLYDPAGLLMQKQNDDSTVFVAMNYLARSGI